VTRWWPALGAGLLALVALERLRPLRRWTERGPARLVRNAGVGAVSTAAVVLLQPLLLLPATAWAQAHGVGLLRAVSLPGWLETTAAVLLLDYTLWHWHRWNHRVGILWRFHLVHHVDRDLDASTALRFHFGEMALSVPYRAAQVALIGADAFAVELWTAALFVSVLFHHSNLRLPPRLDRALTRLLVTPRMHGIHHSEVRREMDSNFSSLLTLWDRLHRTLLLEVPSERVVIGVPGYRDPRWLGLRALLLLPFRRQPESFPGPSPPAGVGLATPMA
jgi:sterol desaturase/sphingolipid hydroxylase (fatty acid hydroxylase superfamily)